MNIKDSIIKYLAEKTNKFFLGSSFITGLDVNAPTTKDFLESFRASSLVHSCTKKIGEKMSTIEWELYRLRGSIAREVEQHEILDLLAKPNAMMSGSQLQEITSIYLSLLGNCYWYKARNGVGKIIELWLMRPDLTSIVPNSDGTINYYKFVVNGKETRFPAEDIIHFKEPDPLSDYYGYGAVQAVMEVIRADVYSKKWNTKFFFNSARPDAILTTEQKIGKADRDEIRERWIQKYGGWENASRVAVLSHGLDYKQVGITQKDMDFANLRIASRDDVMSALGIPKSVMAVTDDVNRSNAEAGIYVFLSETIKPKMEKMADFLNLRLVEEFGDDLLLMSLDPSPEDNAAEDDHYVKAHNKWLTTNEIRIEQGYDPIEGGDYIYQPLGMTALENLDLETAGDNADNKSIVKSANGFMVMRIGKGFCAKNYYDRKKEEKLREIYKRATRGRRSLRMKEELIKNITIEVSKTVEKMVAKTEQEKKSVEEKKIDDEKKDLIWKKFDAKLTAWEKKFRSMMKGLIQKQGERALKALGDSGLGKSVKSSQLELLNFEKEVKIFVKKSKPLFADIVKDAGEDALELVGKKSVAKDFDISDPVTAKWIEDKAMKFGEEVNETTISKLKNTLAEGVLEGESIDQLKKRVVVLFEEYYRGRSKTISRTEVLSANNAGTNFGYKQSGVVEKKEWLATRDGNTRDDHAEADGQVVKVDDSFDVGGEDLEYPGDPSGSPEQIINCRCTTIPVIED